MQLYASSLLIQRAVTEIARQIKASSTMYPDVICPVLNAGIIFGADLLRALHPEIDPILMPLKFTRVPKPSNPNSFTIIGNTSLVNDIVGGVHNRRVLLVDVLMNTGGTMRHAELTIKAKQARSVQSAVLIWKNLPDAESKPDFHGFNLHGRDCFLFGYGLDDVDGRARGASQIFVRD